VEFELVAYIPTRKPRRLEQHLHELFADKRERGEWFKLTQKDIEHIFMIKKLKEVFEA